MHHTHYEIKVRGRLSAALLDDLGGLTATPSASDTVIGGHISDQAALYGVLERLDALGLELIDVRRTAPAR